MKISVITVSYNSSATIADTISSVASQTYKNIDHLVIDGLSKDGTIEILEAHRHPNLTIKSEADAGIYDAMNKGLAQASGDVIGFLNSDDVYADSMVLEKVAAAFQDESVEACYADLIYVSQDKSRLVRYWKSMAFESGSFAKGWSPAHPTFYVRRSALERLGFFDLSFKLAADTEFMMRYLEIGKIKSAYISEVLVLMRVGGATNQSWRNIFKQNREIFLALKKNELLFNKHIFYASKILNRIWQFVSTLFFRANFF